MGVSELDHRRPAGLAIGSLIATAFGLAFIEVNSGGRPGSWPLGIRIAGAVVGIGLFISVFRARQLTRAADPSAAAPSGEYAGFADRRYWRIVGLEALALFGGLAIINLVFGRPVFAVPWIALVVGVHFFGLARLWRVGSFDVLGVVMAVLGVAGFVLGGLGAGLGVVGLASGVGSGVALFVTVATTLAKLYRAGSAPPVR